MVQLQTGSYPGKKNELASNCKLLEERTNLRQSTGCCTQIPTAHTFTSPLYYTIFNTINGTIQGRGVTYHHVVQGLGCALSNSFMLCWLIYLPLSQTAVGSCFNRDTTGTPTTWHVWLHSHRLEPTDACGLMCCGWHILAGIFNTVLTLPLPDAEKQVFYYTNFNYINFQDCG